MKKQHELGMATYKECPQCKQNESNDHLFLCPSRKEGMDGRLPRKTTPSPEESEPLQYVFLVLWNLTSWALVVWPFAHGLHHLAHSTEPRCLLRQEFVFE